MKMHFGKPSTLHFPTIIREFVSYCHIKSTISDYFKEINLWSHNLKSL
jgi:hypothetical protein